MDGDVKAPGGAQTGEELAAPPREPADDQGLAGMSLLGRQRRLLDEQIHTARTDRLRARISLARDLLLGLLALVLVVGALAYAWIASRSETLVVRPFRAPSDLAAQGVDGVVAANRVLDVLQAQHRGSIGARSSETFPIDWEEEAEVAPAEEPPSFRAFDRWLRGRLGRQAVVSGDLYRTPEGLGLTVRAGGEAMTFAAPASDLDRLLTLGGEAAYARLQPYRAALHRWRQGRAVEALELISPLARSGPAGERAWAYTLWAHVLRASDDEAALRAARSALAIDAEHPAAWREVASELQALGRAEAALAARRRALRLLKGGRRADLEEAAAGQWRSAVAAEIAAADGEYFKAAGEAARSATLPEFEDAALTAFRRQALWLALGRDVVAARRLNSAPPLTADGGDAASAIADAASEARAAYEIHRAVEQWPAALAALDRLAQSGDGRLNAATEIWPQRAVTLARLGRLPEARDLIERTPRDCYPCLRARGEIAFLSGDHGEADRWYFEATRIAPSLPFAHAEWGLAKLARGDAADAVRLFRKAQQFAPRWADAYRYEGDALLAQGRAGAALRRYDEAAERAPHWGGLQVARGRAFEARRQARQALKAYRKGAALPLSVADRAHASARMAALPPR